MSHRRDTSSPSGSPSSTDSSPEIKTRANARSRSGVKSRTGLSSCGASSRYPGSRLPDPRERAARQYDSRDYGQQRQQPQQRAPYQGPGRQEEHQRGGRAWQVPHGPRESAVGADWPPLTRQAQYQTRSPPARHQGPRANARPMPICGPCQTGTATGQWRWQCARSRPPGACRGVKARRTRAGVRAPDKRYGDRAPPSRPPTSPTLCPAPKA